MANQIVMILCPGIWSWKKKILMGCSGHSSYRGMEKSEMEARPKKKTKKKSDPSCSFLEKKKKRINQKIANDFIISVSSFQFALIFGFLNFVPGGWASSGNLQNGCIQTPSRILGHCEKQCLVKPGAGTLGKFIIIVVGENGGIWLSHDARICNHPIRNPGHLYTGSGVPALQWR